MKYLALLFLTFWIGLFAKPPEAFFVTFNDHPESSAVIVWLAGAKGEQSVRFRQAGETEWQEFKIAGEPFAPLQVYSVFKASFDGLKPETKYEFFLPEDKQMRSFWTLPEKLSRPLKFVVGGDIYHDAIQTVIEMNKAAAAQDPDFALLGGDLAYAGSRFSIFSENGERWMRFLRTWSFTMVKSDGALIPLLAAIGNHEVNGRFDETAAQAQGFYQLFVTGGLSYREVDFGNYMGLWILDTDHTASIEAQTAWLEASLQKRRDLPYKFALYHVPAYPSVRAFDNKRSVKVRNVFVPLFEKYRLKAVFENHDHAYKRSQPILGGKIDPGGVLYFGDGSWGAIPRKPRGPKESWYIAFSAPLNQVLLVTLTEKGVQYKSIGIKGAVIDSYAQ